MRATALTSMAESTANRYRNQTLVRGMFEPPCASLALGLSGVAYFLLRHASFGGGEPSLHAAGRWAAQAIRATEEEGAFEAQCGPLAFIPGNALHYHEPGVWWVRALVAAAANDTMQRRDAISRFLAATRTTVSPGDITLGSAGLLLGCVQLLESVHDPDLVAPVSHVAEQLADDLATLAEEEGAVPGETSLGYLGAAHGWAGVAHALLRWSRATARAPQREVLTLLDRLIEQRRPSGRWAIHAGSNEVSRSWCHGSVGWAQLWALAYQTTGEGRFLTFAEHSAQISVTSDEQGASLCCGRAGHAFAALTLYRATGERRWLTAAHRAAADAASTPITTQPAHRLLCGDLGVALLLVELEDPGRSAMPVCESIAWG